MNDDDDTMSQLFDIKEKAPGQQLDTAVGTLWGDLNAITFFCDHVINAKSQEMRIDSSWFGRGRRVKQAAYSLAAQQI